MTLWQLAQTGLLRCAASRARIGSDADTTLSSNAGTSGGGGGGGVPRRLSRIHLPRITGEVSKDDVERQRSRHDAKQAVKVVRQAVWEALTKVADDRVLRVQLVADSIVASASAIVLACLALQLLAGQGKLGLFGLPIAVLAPPAFIGMLKVIRILAPPADS